MNISSIMEKIILIFPLKSNIELIKYNWEKL